jgi:predicted kinase
MPKLRICVGVSGSGKSTYASELVEQGWSELNRDNWRFIFFTEGKPDWSLYKFTKERENQITEHLEFLFYDAVKYKANIVVSNTNLNKKDHAYWKSKAEEVGYEFEVKYFPITLEEAFKRDSKRGALSVGREVLIQQWKKWLDITNYKRYVPDESKPKALWVDIDGTVATHEQRGHHEYDKVTWDSPRLEIISMISAWAEKDNLQLIFMSGRPESCLSDTKAWLENYFDSVDYLYMRKDGDMRSDRIVKEELFWEYLEPHWNIVASIDDRPKVIRLQQDLGIPNVINVSQTYEEF